MREKAGRQSKIHKSHNASWVSVQFFDILSGNAGLLMMCLLWINAQRMMGCINALYNTSQQFSLILVGGFFFLEYTATKAQGVGAACAHLVTGRLLFGSTHHTRAPLFFFFSACQVSFWSQAAPLRTVERGCV